MTDSRIACMTALLFPIFLTATLIIKHYTTFETHRLFAPLLLQRHKFSSGHVGTVDHRTVECRGSNQWHDIHTKDHENHLISLHGIVVCS